MGGKTTGHQDDQINRTTSITYARCLGPSARGLTITSRRPFTHTKKYPIRPGVNRRFKAPVIEASHFEAIATAKIAAFIESKIIALHRVAMQRRVELIKTKELIAHRQK